MCNGNRLLFDLCFSFIPPDKSLGSREERRRADAAYEVMDGRAPERSSEVGPDSLVFTVT